MPKDIQNYGRQFSADLFAVDRRRAQPDLAFGELRKGDGRTLRLEIFKRVVAAAGVAYLTEIFFAPSGSIQ
jgi:hypothetical protein